jgi:GNAT superfamily N-acetyltransferase
MAVHPDVRGSGVGAILMRAAKDLAKSRGYLHLRLVTGNTNAARFYAREGFRTYRLVESDTEMAGVKL